MNTTKLYPSRTPEPNIDSEETLEIKIIVMNSFTNSVDNIGEMITYLKDENHKSNRNIRNILSSTILKSVDTFVIFATTSTFVTLIGTGLG